MQMYSHGVFGTGKVENDVFGETTRALFSSAVNSKFGETGALSGTVSVDTRMFSLVILTGFWEEAEADSILTDKRPL
jgi:hypothetical protein